MAMRSRLQPHHLNLWMLPHSLHILHPVQNQTGQFSGRMQHAVRALIWATGFLMLNPVKPVPRVKAKKKNNNTKKRRTAQASATRNSNLKSIPQEMTVACSFPIGMARKIETRSLSLKSDPEERIWKGSYCRWVCGT